MEPEAVYLFNIVSPIINNHDALSIQRTVDERGILLTISVAQEDMGKIIGSQGDSARAIRRLIRQFGLSQNKHVAVKINEPEGNFDETE